MDKELRIFKIKNNIYGEEGELLIPAHIPIYGIFHQKKSGVPEVWILEPRNAEQKRVSLGEIYYTKKPKTINMRKIEKLQKERELELDIVVNKEILLFQEEYLELKIWKYQQALVTIEYFLFFS